MLWCLPPPQESTEEELDGVLDKALLLFRFIQGMPAVVLCCRLSQSCAVWVCSPGKFVQGPNSRSPVKGVQGRD